MSHFCLRKLNVNFIFLHYYVNGTLAECTYNEIISKKLKISPNKTFFYCSFTIRKSNKHWRNFMGAEKVKMLCATVPLGIIFLLYPVNENIIPEVFLADVPFPPYPSPLLTH
jgi:hypothetical protein